MVENFKTRFHAEDDLRGSVVPHGYPEPAAAGPEISAAPAHVPEPTPREPRWQGPQRTTARRHMYRFSTAMVVVAAWSALWAFLFGLESPIYLYTAALAALTVPYWVLKAHRRRRLDRVLRHGVRAKAEVLSIEPVGLGKKYKRVSFRFWGADGAEYQASDVQYQPTRPVDLGPTVAVIDPWVAGRAVLPQLHPVVFAETDPGGKLPAAPRKVLTSGPMPPPTRSLWDLFLWLMAGLALLFGAVKALPFVALAGLLLAGAAAFSPFRRWRQREVATRFRQVTTWGRRRRFRILDLGAPNEGTFPATLCFVDIPEAVRVEVELIAAANLEFDPTKTVFGLVESGWRLDGPGRHVPLVVVPGSDFVTFETPADVERPRVIPAQTLPISLEQSYSLSLHQRAYDLPKPLPQENLGALTIDADQLSLRLGDAEAAHIRGDEPFHMDVTYWQAPHDLEVCVTLRQGRQKVAVRASLEPAAVRADVPLKQSMAPWLRSEDFETFWTWVQVHMQTQDADSWPLTVEDPHFATAMATVEPV